MASSAELLLVLVVLGFGSEALSDSKGGDGELIQEESLSDPTRLDLAVILPDLQQLARVKAIKSTLQKLNDDHSTIELEKLNEANRYEILPAASPVSTSDIREGDAYSLARLFSKMRSINRARELVKNRMDRKRGILQSLATEEDKDYSFVGAPLSKYSSGQRTVNSKWTAQKLRDMILANGQSFRYVTSEDNNNNYHNPEQLSQVLSSRSFDSSNNDISGDANDLVPKNREKRRRCKVDPNLGVKNPSFCDTDAYFGAADYSMRDVWDSAGRR